MATESEKEIEPDKVINISTSNLSDLPDVVASMEMLTVDNELPSSSSSSDNIDEKRYHMRKRVPKIVKTAPSEISNRRCSLKPRKKRCYSMMENDDEIQEYYLDRNIKNKPTTKLETIFEEMNGINENSTMISARSFKRLIQFKSDKRTIDAKIKKRKAKIKRVFGSKMRLKSSSVTMQILVKKLYGIREAISSPDA